MKVLVACEFSGKVRDAFSRRGHDAWSCDLLPTEEPGNHIVGDVLGILKDGWDLMVAHPPCTFLTVAANKWVNHPRFPNRRADIEDAVNFFMALWHAPIRKIAIENPIGIMSSRLRKPNQVIQPWMFGHAETKATCLWLKGIPKLAWIAKTPLPPEKAKAQRLHYLPPSKDRAKIRSITFDGIAEAMGGAMGVL